ncbi:allophanate hydrolase [Lentilactobacillus curieae]|uniref:Allophanate hydrolase n=1 Tax=Lentilactobacillus curieae TaxID=1138822 RepID=A0A1S6QH42_9LACO|nr:5-oxoprolinase subunit PxpB [Lentilactobacillus curieae]AQW20925.1 allophanate hydrolase [Lentilactobacillus curieae]
MKNYNIIPVGDQSISIEFANQIDPTINKTLQIIAKSIVSSNTDGITSVVPAYHTLLVSFDALLTTRESLIEKIQKLIKNLPDASSVKTKTWIIPVCYDSEFAPDLTDVATFGGLTPEQVIKMHTSKKYLIYFLGFLPGFAYMASVDKKIAMPRLSKPRLKIAAGSVGIAGSQTGFYPVDSPGGWRLIGKTPINLYDSTHPEPFYQAGDFIQFKSVSKPEFLDIQQKDRAGEFKPKVVTTNG